MSTFPTSAMVLAAGLGTRMRPFNGSVPKPLVQVGGKALLDYVLDRLSTQEVERAIVNVHYLADQIEQHLGSRKRPRIVISDERNELLGTGGGVVKALPVLGQAPFFHVNSDTIWIDGEKPNLARLAQAFDTARMDALLLLASKSTSIGYVGSGDFSMDSDGRLARRGARESVPFVYAGAAILTPAFFADVPPGPSSMSPLFDLAIQRGRLFGLPLDGVWMHVGTPDAVRAAESTLLSLAPPSSQESTAPKKRHTSS
jgi:MurNAc alpha-1-phosphate uridylyltransferase